MSGLLEDNLKMGVSQKLVRRRDKVCLTDPLSGTKEDYINALCQNNIAWIFMGKGIQFADPQCMETAAGWLCEQLHRLGRCAKVYAKLRGSSTVNYVDMKQAIQDEFKEEYTRLFHLVNLPHTQAFPRIIPKQSQPKNHIIAVTPSWNNSDESMLDTQLSDKKPPSIPGFMPMFPSELLYKNTPMPWVIDDKKFDDKHLVSQKMELQTQIPLLQTPELNTEDIFHNSTSKDDNSGHPDDYWGKTEASIE